MRIAIIGTGNVGGNLGRGWAAKGHEVVFGVRDPNTEKVRSLIQETSGTSSAKGIADAVREASIVVLAVPFNNIEQVIGQCGNLDGKIVLDATNPLNETYSALSVGFTSSAGEQVAALAPGARVVKIFNTTGADNMGNPVYAGGATFMPYAGDDAEAKGVAAGLASDLGFESVDAGPLSNARLLEPLAMLWIYLANAGGIGRDFAFQMVRR